MTLRIARDLSLPLSAITEPLATVARRGRGKTYAGLKLKEQMQKAGQKTAAIDPLDVWYGIRSSTDGKGEGFPVVIFGGDHADVDLNPNMGREVADFLSNEPLSIIIVPDFETNQETVEFMTSFLDRLLKINREPLHLFFDEAEAFAPERPAKYEARMLGAMGRLVKRGRVRGLGASLITQRTASLNKNVLSQVGGLFIMSISSPWDRAPVERWMATNGTAEQMDELKDDLAALPLGEGYFWHPDWDIFKRIKIAERETFDSSATPEVGQKRVVPKTLAEVDVPKVTERFRAQVEKRKAEDPAELQKEIVRLRRELAAKPSAQPEEIEVRVPFLDEKTLGQLDSAIQDFDVCLPGFQDYVGQIEENVARMKKAVIAFRSETALPDAPTTRPRPPRPDPKAPSVTIPPKVSSGDLVVPTDGKVSKPQQRILNALAWFEAVGIPSPRRAPLAAVSGTSSKSSGFEKNISTLRTNGFIDYPSQGRVALTDAGRDLAAMPTIAPTEAALQDAICAMVSNPQAALLRVMIGVYPDSLSREKLAEKAGVSMLSSGFEKNISTLRSFELIDYPQRGYVVALPILFLEKVP